MSFTVENTRECLLVTILLSPAHKADLMIGHWEGDCLLIDPARVAVEPSCDINATRDGTSSMNLRPQLVCLCDLQRIQTQ